MYHIDKPLHRVVDSEEPTKTFILGQQSSPILGQQSSSNGDGRHSSSMAKRRAIVRGPSTTHTVLYTSTGVYRGNCTFVLIRPTSKYLYTKVSQ